MSASTRLAYACAVDSVHSRSCASTDTCACLRVIDRRNKLVLPPEHPALLEQPAILATRRRSASAPLQAPLPALPPPPPPAPPMTPMGQLGARLVASSSSSRRRRLKLSVRSSPPPSPTQPLPSPRPSSQPDETTPMSPPPAPPLASVRERVIQFTMAIDGLGPLVIPGPVGAPAQRTDVPIDARCDMDTFQCAMAKLLSSQAPDSAVLEEGKKHVSALARLLAHEVADLAKLDASLALRTSGFAQDTDIARLVSAVERFPMLVSVCQKQLALHMLVAKTLFLKRIDAPPSTCTIAVLQSLFNDNQQLNLLSSVIAVCFYALHPTKEMISFVNHVCHIMVSYDNIFQHSKMGFLTRVRAFQLLGLTTSKSPFASKTITPSCAT